MMKGIILTLEFFAIIVVVIVAAFIFIAVWGNLKGVGITIANGVAGWILNFLSSLLSG